MRRFVPLPHDALACAGSGPERLVILALFERAHGYTWAPLRISTRELATLSGARLEVVTALLRDLEGRGIITRDLPSGGNRSGSITVIDPTRAERSSGAETERHTRGRTPPSAESRNAGDEAERNAGHSPLEDTRAQKPDQTRPEKIHEGCVQTVEPSKGSLSFAEAVATATALQQTTHPQRGHRLDARDRMAVEEAVKHRDLVPRDLEVIWAYIHESLEGQPTFFRARDFTRWRTILNANAEDRITAARAWEARGRVDLVQQTRPARKTARKSLTDILVEQDQQGDEDDDQPL